MQRDTPTQLVAADAEVEQLREQVAELAAKLTEEHKLASLGRLSAAIVHEVNTPIGSIVSNNEVLTKSIEKIRTLLAGARESNQPPPAKVLDLMETMASLLAIDKIACERIFSIVRSMKSFARVEENELRVVDLNELLRNTLKLSGCTFRRRIAVETDLEEMPPIECYPGLLNQVFLNLEMNAAQAIVGEGKIIVRSRREGDVAHISITDTGPGIRPEDRSKIFGSGFTTKPMGEGTGLGLSISREIVVDAHGGSIDFESEPGKGATFHVRLPLVQPKRAGAATD